MAIKVNVCNSLVCLLCLLSSSCVFDVPPTPRDIPSTIELIRFEDAEQQIHYASSGNAKAPGLLFIHGTPGSWQAFQGYLQDEELQHRYLMTSIDRLGWGKSTAESVASFAHQADAALAVMKRYPDRKWIIVGHSLGASMAPKIALLSPQSIAGLLLLAGSFNPDLGKPRWYNRAANFGLARWLLSDALRFSNDEIMHLRAELETLDEQIRAVHLPFPVIVMQGSNDQLVSPYNADYIADQWPPYFSDLRVIKLETAGHFLPWDEFEQVKQVLLQFDAQPH